MVEEDGGPGDGPDTTFKADLDHDGRWGHLPDEAQWAKDPARIREIAAADAARLPTMRDHRDGWEKMAELGADINAFLAERMSARLDGNIAKSVHSVGEQAARTRDSAELFGAAADLNKQGFDEIITHVTAFDDTVNGLENERDLLPGSKPGESKLSDDAAINNGLDEELREALKVANLGYNRTYTGYAYKPPMYDGAPEWTGPQPQTPPGWGGAPGSDGATAIPPRPGTGIPPAPGDRPDVIVDDGPVLQNPGVPTTPAPGPAPVTPSPAPGPTPPPIGGLPIGPGIPPGGGARPLPPPLDPRPIAGPPGARPTPGMGTPPSRSLPGTPARATAGGRGGVGAPTGRGAPTGSKASRALLPSQRAGTGAVSARAVPQPGTASRFASVTGQFGGPARTTVPSVIGSRGTGKPGGPVTSPVRNPGTVFGERVNKGQAAKPVSRKPGGILDQRGIGQKPTPRRSWSNTPQRRRLGNAFLGKVIGGRRKPVDPTEAAADKAVLRAETESGREALATWRADRDRPSERLSRKDIGRVFGQNGWEN